MTARKARLEQYKSRDGFRWRLISTNGRVIADSAEAYSSANALERAVKSVINAFALGVIEITDGVLTDQ